jgi:hypothetical protein
MINLWPMVGIAKQPLDLQGLRARLQQEFGRLQQPEFPDAPTGPLTLIPGFFTETEGSGLTTPRGVIFGTGLSGFPGFLFVVEQSLNRVVVGFGTTFTPFATGLSTPTDILPAPGFGNGPFGNFLYVTETGANKISKIDSTGAVTPFAALPAAPKRMAFSAAQDSAFGDFLFVTLADGRIVKVSPAGTVSPCASGLSGPEGLVLGPGGAFFKTVLFVAESTANRISKVTPACTVSPFASTGLSGPVGLEISPGGGYGPTDTLYVANAMTKVDRVDKNGNVTPFASGFTKVDTVRLDLFFPPLINFSPFLNMSDTGSGTVEDAVPFSPFVSQQLVGCHPCRAGDIFTVSLSLRNPGPIPRPVELKAGFRLPDGTPINVSPLNNKHFEVTLPPGFTFQGNWLSFPMPAIPPGLYCYEAILNEPELSFGFIGLSQSCFMVLP